MRLNLGCGAFPLRGWVNIDLYDEAHADVVADVAALPYADGAAEEIYAGHLLEHFPRRRARALLREWWRALAPGGALTVVTPDCRVARAWHRDGRLTDAELAVILICDGPPGRSHHAEYDADSLRATLARALPDADLAPVDLRTHPHLVSRIGWQCGWVARKGAA